MSDIYKAMIQKAAVELKATQQLHPFGDCIVWAVPTYGSEAGQLIITGPEGKPDARFYNRSPGYMPRVIRPGDNRASQYRYWATVPYSAQFHVLYEACRREPILPSLPSTNHGDAA